MTDHAHELRRYSRKIGHPAGDVPAVMLAAADEIERLAARLEAAEKERDFAKVEIARLHDDIRELTDVRVLDEEDRDLLAWLQGEAKAKLDRLEAAEKERDALRAKIEAMEKQEPVGKFTQHPSNGLWEQDGYGDNPEASPLYALPGAKGE